MKPLTASELRAAVSRLPEQFREEAMMLLASAFDGGQTAGYANLPRLINPFLPKRAAKTKGKR